MDTDRFYLDFNATSPPSKSVIDWLKGGDLLFANPASQHSAGKASRKLVNESRTQIYSTFHQNEKETNLFFHSGASESFSTFAYSFSEWARQTKRNLVICYSKLDHPAVHSLSERWFGEKTTFFELKIDQNLDYLHDENLALLCEKKRLDPSLIILYHHLWVHNESGVVSPLRELEKLKQIPDLYIHVDAVQAPGKIQDWQSLVCGDVFTFSSHKFGGMKGIGFSFYPKSLPYYPFITGGAQQSGRSGTENVLGIKSVALALSDLKEIDIQKNFGLKNELEAFISHELEGIGEVISLKGSLHNSNTIYFYLNNLTSDIALALFDLSGLMISAGSACSSGAARPSPLLLHLGLSAVARNGLRLSLGFNPSSLEISQIKLRFQQIIAKTK